MADQERMIREAGRSAINPDNTLVDQVLAAEAAAFSAAYDCLKRPDLSDKDKGIFAQTLKERALLQIFGKVHEVVPRPGNLTIRTSKHTLRRRQKTR